MSEQIVKFQHFSREELKWAPFGAAASALGVVLHLELTTPPHSNNTKAANKIYNLQTAISNLKAEKADLRHLSPKAAAAGRTFIAKDLHYKNRELRAQTAHPPKDVQPQTSVGQSLGEIFGSMIVGGVVFVLLSSRLRHRQHLKTIDIIANQEVDEGLEELNWWANRRSTD